MQVEKGQAVFSKGRKEQGTVIGTRSCQMAGCTGIGVIVKWPNGKRTVPCAKGMKFDKAKNEWEIL